MPTKHILVSGKVQGVFFRYNTKKKAQELDLQGHAKNLPDGFVEIIAQGEENKIIQLIEFLKSNPGASTVEDIKIKDIEEKVLTDFKTLD